MTAPTLWLVEVDDRDWEYDRFQIAAVWATSAEDAERIVRAARRYPDEHDPELWIINPEWRLHVRPAPAEGVALVHWHAG